MVDDENKIYLRECGLVEEDGTLITIGTRTESNLSIKIKKEEFSRLNIKALEMATYEGIECKACLRKFKLILPLPFSNDRLGDYKIVEVSGYHPEFVSVENPEYNQYREFKATTNRKGNLILNSGSRYTPMLGVHVGVRRKFVFEPAKIRPVDDDFDVIYARAGKIIPCD